VNNVPAVEKAKLAVVNWTKEPGAGECKWLRADLDSYGLESNRFTVFVLEGSPPRGFVVVVAGVATAYGWNGRIIKIFEQN
jgi:hypothetical protein